MAAYGSVDSIGRIGVEGCLFSIGDLGVRSNGTEERKMTTTHEILNVRVLA
jgi:hypothetical protein